MFFLYACTTSARALKIHSEDFGKLNDCTIVPSEGDKWLSFDNHCRKEHVPICYLCRFRVRFGKDEWEF